MVKRKKEGAAPAELGTPPLKFEAALERLEKIVEEMESGDLPLEAILKKYEEGSGLALYCSRRLSEAEKRIEILMKNKEGALETRAFDPSTGSGRGDGQEERQEEGKKEELF
jgi:exodeoxyribonuclease VII small subunit